MSIKVLSTGDTVNYPNPRDVHGDLKLICKDRWIKRYPSGKYYIRYLYGNMLEVLATEMWRNIDSDLDNVVMIDGAEGSGKSSLAYALATTFNPDFDMAVSYALNLKDLISLIHDRESPPGTIFWLDEASVIAGNRDWMLNDNKTFIKILEMFRSRRWVLIMCMPDGDRSDVYLRENRIRYRLHTEWLEWDKSPEKKRGYFLLTRIDYKATSGFRPSREIGYGTFPPMRKEISEQYMRIKTETQNTFLEEVYERKTRKGKEDQTAQANRRMMLHFREQGLSTAEISRISGMAEQTVLNSISKARKERAGYD